MYMWMYNTKPKRFSIQVTTPLQLFRLYPYSNGQVRQVKHLKMSQDHQSVFVTVGSYCYTQE